MQRFLNSENIFRLIDEAVDRSGKLGGPYDGDLTPGFLHAQETLKTTTDGKAQLTLLLAAARNWITQVEQRTIRLIIGDAPITGQQMSHLVRIRMICAELINLLSNLIERVRSGPAAA
jgi:hypothetical protein